jgi:hypothetical protein
MDNWFVYGFPFGALAIGTISAIFAWRSSRAFDRRHPNLVSSHLSTTSSAGAVVHNVPGKPSRDEDPRPRVG